MKIQLLYTAVLHANLALSSDPRMTYQTQSHSRLSSQPSLLKRVINIRLIYNAHARFCSFNPFKPSGVKWLHFKVFRAILV